MWKTYKKTIILTVILILLPMVVGVVLWDKLPEMMVTHWGVNNEPNGWMSRPMAVFGLPIICAVLHLFCIFATDKDKRKENLHRKSMAMVLWIVPVATWVCSAFTYGYVFYEKINVGLICCLLVGLLFIALGNQLPRQMQNHVFGIRTKLTLSDEDVWRASHRFGGWVMTLGGVVVILAALLQWWWMALAVFVVVFAATLIYPRWYYNQREKK